jgi:hypothetical protein
MPSSKGGKEAMRYLKPAISQSPVLNILLQNQYTAQDAVGSFNFTFDTIAIQDDCNIGPAGAPVTLTVNAVDDVNVTYSFNAFPYPNPSLGNGQVINNHFEGSINDNGVNYTSFNLTGCTVNTTSTLEFDILGAGEFSEPVITFNLTYVSGSCNTFSGPGSCDAAYRFVIQS